MGTFVKGSGVANATSYELFEVVDGAYNSLATGEEINFEVSALGLAEGSHELVVKAMADGYEDSDYSNAVVFTVAGDGGGSGGTTTTITLYTSALGWSVLHYNGSIYMTANDTFKGWGSKAIALDVSGLVGKTLKIKATQSVVANAYYSLFTNALPGDIASINAIDGFAYSKGAQHSWSESDIVEAFVVSTTDKTEATVSKVVPSGAKYLFFATLDNYGGYSVEVA